MPQVIPALVFAGVQYLAFEVSIQVVLATLAVNLAMIGLMGALSKKQTTAFATDAAARQKLIQSPVEPRRIIYGEAMVSGPLVAYFAESTPIEATTTGTARIPSSAPYQITLPNPAKFVSVQWVQLMYYDQVLHTTRYTDPTPGWSNSGATFTFDAADAGQTVGFHYTIIAGYTAHAWHWFVIALAGHEVDEIGEVWLGTKLVGPLNASGYATTGDFAHNVRVLKHLGKPDQLAEPALIAASNGKWTQQHRGVGVAYLVVALQHESHALQSGIPSIRAFVRGKKIYDPRTGATQWSNNAALVIRDYLAAPDGLYCSADEIDDPGLIVAANACDERVPMAEYSAQVSANATSNLLTFAAKETKIDTGDGVTVSSTGDLPGGLSAATTYYVRLARNGSRSFYLAASYADAMNLKAIDITTTGTGKITVSHVDQARYTCDGVLSLADKPIDILDKMRTAMAGAVVYAMGQWRVSAGVYSVPTLPTITADDLRGPIKIQARTARKDLFNGVSGTYIDPNSDWQASNFPPLTNSHYEAQDGGQQILRDIDFPWTINPIRVQRLAKVYLEHARQQISVELPCKLTVLPFTVWSTCQLTLAQFGWVNKVFLVTGWQLAQDGLGVDLTLQEEAAQIYAWDKGNATQVDYAPDSDLPDKYVFAPPGVPQISQTSYSTGDAGGVKTQVSVEWQPSPSAFATLYVLEYISISNAWDAWREVARTVATAITLADVAPGMYQFRVCGVNQWNQPSLFSTSELVEVYRDLPVPPTPNISVRGTADGVANVTLDLCEDEDVRTGGRLILRFVQDGGPTDWNFGVLLRDQGWPGDVLSVNVPLATGYYMAKWRNSMMAHSSPAASFYVVDTTPGATISTLQEDPGFAGVGTNTQVQSFSLYLADLGGGGGYVQSGSYAFHAKMDLTTVKTVRLVPIVHGEGFAGGFLWDDRTNNIDDWVCTVDGNDCEDCEATLMVRVTNDAPNGASPNWGEWHELPGPAKYTCRGVQARLDFTSADPTHVRTVFTLRLYAKQ